MKFPTQVFKSPGKFSVHGKTYSIKGVSNETELSEAEKNGWKLNRDEALFPEKFHKDESVSNSPPTREELELKANELCLKFDGRTSDKKLRQMIEEKL